MVNFNKAQYTYWKTACSVIPKMWNVSGENCRGNHNTYFIMDNLFSEVVPFMRKCGKTIHFWTGHGWQYGAHALHAGYLGLQLHNKVG